MCGGQVPPPREALLDFPSLQNPLKQKPSIGTLLYANLPTLSSAGVFELLYKEIHRCFHSCAAIIASGYSGRYQLA